MRGERDGGGGSRRLHNVDDNILQARFLTPLLSVVLGYKVHETRHATLHAGLVIRCCILYAFALDHF